MPLTAWNQFYFSGKKPAWDPVSNMTARSYSVATILRHSDLMKDPYTYFYQYNNTRENTHFRCVMGIGLGRMAF